MTVADLLRLLQPLPPDAVVLHSCDCGYQREAVVDVDTANGDLELFGIRDGDRYVIVS